MKVRQAYSVICLIFATNFKNSITEENLKKLNEDWVIKTQNVENQKGLEHWKNAIHENVDDIAKDLNSFKVACDLKFFRKISEDDVIKFYNSINYTKVFGELKACHISNMLSLLAIILKEDDNENIHILLGLYLSNYLIPSVVLFAKFIKYNVKTEYYKALAEFLIDFCKTIKGATGLRIEIE